MRYQTKHDRHTAIKNAIRATGPNGNSIYIDLLTITDSSEENPANYQIKHGNYYPANDHGKATWEQFYIDGKSDGFPEGFKTLEQVESFIQSEIQRVRTQVTSAIIDNEYKANGVDKNRWDVVLEAWETFYSVYLDAKGKGRLIDIEQARKQKSQLMN